jgi:hypothetical protein
VIYSGLTTVTYFIFKIHEAISREKKAREAKHITRIAVNNTCKLEYVAKHYLACLYFHFSLSSNYLLSEAKGREEEEWE